MDCNCTSYTCLSALFNPCSEGVQLDVVATETGDWSADIYFNGVPTQISFAVTSGDKIIIPTSVLNEYYTHEFVLYNTAGTLVGCYHLNAKASKNAGEFTPIPPTGAATYVQIFQMGTPPDTLNESFGDIVQINNADYILWSGLEGATLLDVQQVGSSLQPVDNFGINAFYPEMGEIDLGQSYADTYFKVIYTK